MSSIGLIVTILRGKGKMKRLFMVCETMQYIGIVVLSCFSALLLLGSGKRMSWSAMINSFNAFVDSI